LRDYPRLCALLQMEKQEQLNIDGLRRLVHFKQTTQEGFRNISEALNRCRTVLQKLTSRKRFKASPKPTSTVSRQKARRLSFPISQVRLYADTVHEHLLRYWRCNCCTPHNVIKIRLAAHSFAIDTRTEDVHQQVEFNMLLGVSADVDHHSWRKTKIQVLKV